MKEPEGIIFVVIQAPISNLKPCSARACHTDDKRLLPGKCTAPTTTTTVGGFRVSGLGDFPGFRFRV